QLFLDRFVVEIFGCHSCAGVYLRVPNECKCMKPRFNPVRLAARQARTENIADIRVRDPREGEETMKANSLFILSCAVATVSGCGGGSTSPAMPTVSPTSQTPACPQSLTCSLLRFHLTGSAADGDSKPVAGATVTMRPWIFGQSSNPVSTSADGAGFYELDFDAMRDVAGGVGNAVAEQSAYEHDNRYIVATRQEAVQNFYLCRIERISAGESLSLTVRPDDTFCGLSDEWRCRTVRITAPATGTLSVSLISNDAPNLTGLELYQQGQQF